MFQEAHGTPIDLPTCTFAACQQPGEVVPAAGMTPPAGVSWPVDHIFRFNSCGMIHVKMWLHGKLRGRDGHSPSSWDRRQIEDAELSDAYKVGARQMSAWAWTAGAKMSVFGFSVSGQA